MYRKCLDCIFYQQRCQQVNIVCFLYRFSLMCMALIISSIMEIMKRKTNCIFLLWRMNSLACGFSSMQITILTNLFVFLIMCWRIVYSFVLISSMIKMLFYPCLRFIWVDFAYLYDFFNLCSEQDRTLSILFP